MSKTEDQLEADSTWWENGAKRCGWSVVAGLVLEVVLTAVFPAHEPKATNWYLGLIETWGPVFADILVAAGVWGEIFCSGKVRTIEGKLRRTSNDKVIAATNAARGANLKVAEFQHAMLRATLPRQFECFANLDGTDMFSALKSFPGSEVQIEWAPDPEAENLANEIARGLSKFGWKTVSEGAAWDSIIGEGVHVFVPRNARPAEAQSVAKQAGAALAKAFTEVGFGVGNLPVNCFSMDSLSNSPRLCIRVGARPISGTLSWLFSKHIEQQLASQANPAAATKTARETSI